MDHNSPYAGTLSYNEVPYQGQRQLQDRNEGKKLFPYAENAFHWDNTFAPGGAMSSILFSPLDLGGLILANRIVIAPMCQYSGR